MTTDGIESTAALKMAINGYTPCQLLEEARFCFGFFGNAAHNQQGERKDDAIERFDAVLAELSRRLMGGDREGGADGAEVAGQAEVRAEDAAGSASDVGGRRAAIRGAGEGWVLLVEGDALQSGDGFLHPDLDGWIDYECRPDMFRGPAERVHSGWAWRRRDGAAQFS